MNPADLASSALSIFSARFLLVILLPVTAGSLYVLCLVWAGTPDGGFVASAIGDTAGKLGAGRIALLLLALLVVGFLFQAALPVIHRFWQVLPVLPGRSARRRAHVRSKHRLEATRDAVGHVLTLPAHERGAVLLAARQAARRLDNDYPPHDAHVLPTVLGNSLGALWAGVGRSHGWSADAAWPRLYAVLPDSTRLLVDDARNALDQALTLTTVWVLAAFAGLPLLIPAGWWVLLTMVPLALAVLSHRCALAAVPVYRTAVQNAFDLHRLDLLRALHLPLPSDTAAERLLATSLCDTWHRGTFLPTPYDHP
ncbi:hypothetical protein ABZ348_26530 [Streptomyces sp. NPDC005963]|uniref:hypothetical protein n=1 Tax=Streptomyces sp. NPDC005963 TaxID=3156721 RepID=UPI0033E47759